MNVYESEKEQIEALKNIWKKYGSPLVIGMILAVAISMGWRYWQQYQSRIAEQASIQFDQLLSDLPNSQFSQLQTQVDSLVSNYATTPYASLAQLILARQAVQNNNLDAAKDRLTWVMQNGKVQQLRELARIRAARVLAAMNKTQDAIQLLQQENFKDYLALSEEVLGDVYQLQGKIDLAHQAYQQAYDHYPDAMRGVLAMKLNATASS